ncbi:Conserved hypothetical protein [Shewanella piezotolerans WP3]|uniref:DUF2897 domain-containing protein n=1 Tax=Shewanella piezotolerans (strain WP3 / JCM 13877) TaxID=225849 RepID=B8CMP7_SHEPW|nr:DUF2897 family protein [Shewanella piezotolerans]ACJ29437.1 Conserved hypothetical protein [Shewanella piezotolerans WP3]
MSDLEVGLLILLVIGVIASNLAVLKYSAKYKMPQFGKDQKKHSRSKAPESVAKGKADGSDKHDESSKEQ